MSKKVRDNLHNMELNPTQLVQVNAEGGMDRELCIVEGCYKLCMNSGKKADGTVIYKAKCSKHNNEASHLKNANHRKHLLKLDVIVCYDCGIRLEKVDTEVHHLNGNHFDNRESNLRDLCTVCHKVYTLEEKQYLPYEIRFGMSAEQMKAKMKACGYYYGKS